MLEKMALKSKASGNVLRLMTGTSIAQAIPIAVSPILTRLYSPEDFGIYALFLAIMAVVSSIASGRYELAIVLPSDDEDAFNIAALCVLIAAGVSIFLLLAVLAFGYRIALALETPSLYLWLYVLPLVIFASALWNVLNYLNTRFQNYTDIAVSQVYRSVTLAASQIVIGWLKPGAAGLVFGQLLSSSAANGRMLKNLPSLDRLWRLLSWKGIKTNAIRYLDFPKYTSWAALTNAVSGSITQILLSTVYSVKTLGFYTLTQRALSIPATLISNAVGQVLLQKASQERIATGNTIAIFLKTLSLLLAISAPIFIGLYFFVERLFVFVFGEEWRVAGEFAKLLMPLFAIKFVVSPLTMMNIVNEKNKFAMLANFGILIFSVGTICFGQYFEMDEFSMLATLAFVLGFYYLVYLAFIYIHVRNMSRLESKNSALRSSVHQNLL